MTRSASCILLRHRVEFLLYPSHPIIVLLFSLNRFPATLKIAIEKVI